MKLPDNFNILKYAEEYCKAHDDCIKKVADKVKKERKDRIYLGSVYIFFAVISKAAK